MASAEVIQADPMIALMDPESVKALSTPSGKEGKYLFKEVPEGDFKIWVKASPKIFKKFYTWPYSEPGTSPFEINIIPGGNMLDLVMELKPMDN